MASQKTILIVEDDTAHRHTLAAQLIEAGFRVRQMTTAADAAAAAMARETRFDAIILDVKLADGDGRDLCARLRRHGVKLPIIVLSGPCSEDDVVRGLDSGANDFVLRPFRFAELHARLRAQLRMFEASEDVSFRIGPYIFRPAAKLLQDTVGGRRIRLTEKEAAVLKYLYRAEGRPIGRDVLLREVWGYNPNTDSHTVETHIYRLRRKVEPDPGRITLLINEGGGYRLCDAEGEAMGETMAETRTETRAVLRPSPSPSSAMPPPAIAKLRRPFGMQLGHA
jgi:DNA-binding response OmpR family regulator